MIDFYYRLLGISPDTCPQEAKKELNSRIRSIQALVNSPDKNTREKAEEEMRILFKARGLLLQQEDVEKQSFPGKTTVKLQKLGVAMSVEVVLNGKEKRDFILDTGATLTSITPSLADALGLRVSSVHVPCVTANGEIETGSLTKIPSIKVGDMEMKNVTTLIFPLDVMGFSGLLGLSFLNRFELTLNSQQGLLTLEKEGPLDGNLPSGERDSLFLMEMFLQDEVSDERDLEEKIDYYEETVRLQPDFKEAYYYLSFLYHKREELDKALATIEKVLQIDPNSADSHYLASVFHLEKGNLPQVIKEIEEVERLAPDHEGGKELKNLLRIEKVRSKEGIIKSKIRLPEILLSWLHKQ